MFPYLPSSSSFIELIWLLTPSRLLDILVFHNLTIFNGSLLAFSINPFIQSYKRNYRWSNVTQSIIFQFNIYPGSFSLSVTFLGKRKSRSHRSLLSIKMSGVGDFRWHYQPHKSVKPSSRQSRTPGCPRNTRRWRTRTTHSCWVEKQSCWHEIRAKKRSYRMIKMQKCLCRLHSVGFMQNRGFWGVIWPP